MITKESGTAATSASAYVLAGVCAISGLFTSKAIQAADNQPSPAIEIASVNHDGPVRFDSDVLPILRRKCLACHNATEAQSDLVLETPATMLQGGSEGPAVVAGKSADSLLLLLASHQRESHMPPDDNDVGAKPMTPDELGLIKLWIDQGAQGEVSLTAAPVTWQVLPPGVNPIYAVAISPDGQYAAAGRANQIFMYHVPSKREIGRLTDPELLKSGIYSKPGVAHLDLVQSLAFSADSRTLASGGYRTVKLWQREAAARKAELTGLDSPARSMAVSSDGKWAAVGEENGQIQLFDLASGQKAGTLSGHTGTVASVCFAADGPQLISGSADKTVRLWNVAERQQLGVIETPAAVNAVAFVNQSKQITSGGEDKVIRVWELPTESVDKPADPAKPVKEIQGHGGPITSLAAILPAGTQLVSGSQDSTVRIWNLAGGNLLRQMNHGGPVTSVAVRADGQRIASASSNNVAKLWNAANGQQIAELRGDFRAKIAVEDLVRAGNLMAKRIKLAGDDLKAANDRKAGEEKNATSAREALTKAEQELKAKDEAAKKPLADKQTADTELEQANMALAQTEEAKKAADAGTDDAAKKKAAQDLTQVQNRVKQADAKVKQLAGPAQKASDERAAAERALQAAQRSIQRSDESVKKAIEAIPSFENVVKKLEEEKKQVDAQLDTAKKSAAAREKPLSAVAFSPHGAVLATAGQDQAVQTWDAENGAAIDSFTGQGANITALAFTADGNVISTAQTAASVWETNPQWKLARVIGSIDSTHEFADRVTTLGFSPDSKHLATGGGEPSRSGELKIWNVADGALVRAIDEPHSDTIFGLEFSPDGQQIASCGADRFVKIFNVADGSFVRSFEGHTHHVLGVSWRADGRLLASSGADNVIKVWDPRTGDQSRTIQGFNKEVTSVRFVAIDDTIVVSCGDRNVQMKNAVNGGNVRNFPGATDFMYSVSASADGKTILAGGQDSVVRIWQENGQPLATFTAPKPDQTAATSSGP